MICVVISSTEHSKVLNIIDLIKLCFFVFCWLHWCWTTTTTMGKVERSICFYHFHAMGLLLSLLLILIFQNGISFWCLCYFVRAVATGNRRVLLKNEFSACVCVCLCLQSYDVNNDKQFKCKHVVYFHLFVWNSFVSFLFAFCKCFVSTVNRFWAQSIFALRSNHKGKIEENKKTKNHISFVIDSFFFCHWMSYIRFQ